MIKRVAILVALILLASCGGKVKDGPPSRDVDVSKIPDAVPRHEPITKAGNKSPYRILGKTYYVMPSYKNYRERGLASWYGTKFHGNKTSNGEPYDMYAMTAAHKTLPIPCYVQVTNLRNGRKVIVRVNDRGPFHGGRIIDLSYVAARKLGIFGTGTAEVEVVSIDPASYRPGMDLGGYVADSSSSIQGSGAFLQVGAFSTRSAADRYRRDRLGTIKYPSEIRQAYAAGKSLYKVLVGPFASEKKLYAAKDSLQRRQKLDAFVFYD